MPYTYLEWQLPDGKAIHYKRISPGTGYSDALYEHAVSSPVFGRSRIGWNGGGWDLSLEDGTTYLSPEAYHATRSEQASLVGIFDKDGNEVRLMREPNGDLTEIKSPNGRWIRLSYNNGRISQAKDSSGNVVEYSYDSENRLRTVRYSDERTTSYDYDDLNRVIRIAQNPGGFALDNTYDSAGRVIEQTSGGRTYKFCYVTDDDGAIIRVDAISRGHLVTRVELYHDGYTIENSVKSSPCR